jgi:hypothetical protein
MSQQEQQQQENEQQQQGAEQEQGTEQQQSQPTQHRTVICKCRRKSKPPVETKKKWVNKIRSKFSRNPKAPREASEGNGTLPRPQYPVSRSKS